MPNQETINLYPNQSHFASLVDEEKEKTRIIFRFSDLTLRAQQKLCALIKCHSNCWTVRRPGGITPKQIFHALRVTNPPIIENWRDYFSGRQLSRYWADKISRIAYYLNKRKPTERTITKINRIIETPFNDGGRRQIEMTNVLQSLEELNSHTNSN